jgi:hypothetical protein
MQVSVQQLIQLDNRIRYHAKATQDSLRFMELLPIQDAHIIIKNYLLETGGIPLDREDVRRNLLIQENWILQHFDSLPTHAITDSNMLSTMALEILPDILNEPVPMSCAPFVLMRIQIILKNSMMIPPELFQLPPLGLYLITAGFYCVGAIKAGYPSPSGYKTVTDKIIKICEQFLSLSDFLKQHHELWHQLFQSYIKHYQNALKTLAENHYLVCTSDKIQSLMEWSEVPYADKKYFYASLDAMG